MLVDRRATPPAASPRPIWKKTRASSSGAAAHWLICARCAAARCPFRRPGPSRRATRRPRRAIFRQYRAARLAHALRRAARPGVDVEALLEESVSQLTDEDVVEGAAFLHEWVQGEATKSPESRRDAAFGATIERLNGLVLAEFPSSTASARLALGLLLSPKFPVRVRAAVWRVCGLAGTAAHLRVDVDACACSAEDAELLVDDVLLCLKHDPPADAPCVLLAKQHLAAFLRAAPARARESRAGLLRARASAAQYAELLGARDARLALS